MVDGDFIFLPCIFDFPVQDYIFPFLILFFFTHESENKVTLLCLIYDVFHLICFQITAIDLIRGMAAIHNKNQHSRIRQNVSFHVTSPLCTDMTPASMETLHNYCDSQSASSAAY